VQCSAVQCSGVKCSAVLHVLGILDLDLDLGWAGLGWDGMGGCLHALRRFNQLFKPPSLFPLLLFPLPSSLFPLPSSLFPLPSNPPAYPDFTLLYRYSYLGNWVIKLIEARRVEARVETRAEARI